MNDIILKDIFNCLKRCVGEIGSWPAESVYEIVLGAILVQNTTWNNAKMSVEKIGIATKFDPLIISKLKIDEIAKLIYSSGFQCRKSRMIKEIFLWLSKFDYDVDKIKDYYGDNLREALLDFYGIGNETADVILLYVFQRPCFVADKYSLELFQQINCRYATDYMTLKKYIESEAKLKVIEWQEFHGLIDEHGKLYAKDKSGFINSISNLMLSPGLG